MKTRELWRDNEKLEMDVTAKESAVVETFQFPGSWLFKSLTRRTGGKCFTALYEYLNTLDARLASAAKITS